MSCLSGNMVCSASSARVTKRESFGKYSTLNKPLYVSELLLSCFLTSHLFQQTNVYISYNLPFSNVFTNNFPKKAGFS